MMSNEIIDITSLLKINNYSNICRKCLTEIPNKHCPKFMECPYQIKCKGNVVINTYDNGNEREIVYYKKTFFKNTDLIADKTPDRRRKYKIDEDGYKVPISDDISILDFNRVKRKSKNRALDQSIGFCRNNLWNYFITLTFSNSKIDRLDDDAVKYAWQKFRQRLQYRYPDIEIFLVNERHSKGGIHFHGFMGKCDLTNYLRIAINKNRFKYKFVDNEKVLCRDKQGNLIPNKYYLQPLKSFFGDQVYNLVPEIYDDGYLTIVKIKPGTAKAQITNYLTKYIAKDYILSKSESKLYYRTHNLTPKIKQSAFWTKEEFESILYGENMFDYIITHIKETDKLISINQKKIE